MPGDHRSECNLLLPALMVCLSELLCVRPGVEAGRRAIHSSLSPGVLGRTVPQSSPVHVSVPKPFQSLGFCLVRRRVGGINLYPEAWCFLEVATRASRGFGFLGSWKVAVKLQGSTCSLGSEGSNEGSSMSSLPSTFCYFPDCRPVIINTTSMKCAMELRNVVD